jgi:prophage maintenance system killer protein
VRSADATMPNFPELNGFDFADERDRIAEMFEQLARVHGIRETSSPGVARTHGLDALRVPR